ncbi:hypothetical protein ACEPAG_3780 [Sanghuangporus baumii]
MKSSEHALDKQLVLQIDDLQLERSRTESSYMFGGKDEADTVCASLGAQHEEVICNVEEALSFSRKSFVRRLKKRIPGRTDRYIQEKDVILGVAERLTEQYKVSSIIRSSFEMISKVAYMTKPPVITDAYNKIRRTEWKMAGKRFMLLSDPAGQEWKDIQALCSAMILLFEHLISPELSQNPVLSTDVEKLLDLLKLLGNSFYQLLSYPECFSFTSWIFGYAAAMVHVALQCAVTIRNSFGRQHEDPCDNGKSLGYYGRQVKSLCVIADDILDTTDLILREANKPERNAVVPKNAPGTVQPISSRISQKETNKDEVIKAHKHLGSCKYFDVKDIKCFGIPEISLTSGEGHQIGFGSSSIVFERRVLEGTRRFAVKEPSGVTASNRDTLWNASHKSSSSFQGSYLFVFYEQKFGREAQVWRLLKHDNVLSLRGFCLLSNDLPGLVMDAHRWNFKDFVKQCSPSSHQRLELLHGASEGLSYLHSESIAHGDLRACNILVKENALRTGFSALLADFGTAYFVNGATDPAVKETKFMTTHDQVGNVGWLSPELLRNVTSQGEEDAYPYVSIPGDVYSFGCALLEIIFDRDPYQGCSSDEAKKEKILQGLLPASLEETSVIYYEFLLSLWDPIPARRSTAEQVADRILIFLQNDNL